MILTTLIVTLIVMSPTILFFLAFVIEGYINYPPLRFRQEPSGACPRLISLSATKPNFGCPNSGTSLALRC